MDRNLTDNMATLEQEKNIDDALADQSLTDQGPEKVVQTSQASSSQESLPSQHSPGYKKSLWAGIGGKFAGTKLLGKKFGSASRLVVSSRMWMHTIPTQDCDILMTFPSTTDDQVLMWLLSRIRDRSPDISVHVRHHSNTRVYGFYCTSSYDSLLRNAEEVGIKKLIKPEFGGGMKEFVYEDQDFFEGVEDSSLFLTSEERQSIVRHMLYNLRAIEGDQINKVKFLEGQPIVPYLLSKGIAEQVLPLHNNNDLTYLRKNWVQAFIRAQPMEKICEYFGVKIAMYFTYLGHYTKALTIPTLVGMVLWFMDGTSQYVDDVCFVIFAFFNVLWATLYLEHWKRKSSEMAYKWGTLDKEDELLTEPRPLFHGYLVKSQVTGSMEPYYPVWKRHLFRYFVSAPVIVSCLCVVFAIMWCIFELQDWVNVKIKLGDFPFFCKFLPKVLLALSIGILDDIYKKIAFWLNDKENYRLEESYENNLIIKLILFQFVNSFLSLFYIAFYLRDMDRLKDQLAALLITRQVIGNIKEAVIPFIVGKAKLMKIGYKMTEGLTPSSLEKRAKQFKDELQNDPKTPDGKVKDGEKTPGDVDDKVCTKDPNERTSELRHRGVTKEIKTTPDGDFELTHSGASMTQAEVEAAQKVYEGTFDDYLEMFIQFGYVTLFSSAFPLAALCALLNNIIEIRSDAFKLCMTLQRPFGQRVESIGSWQDSLEVMSVIAVMVNCALIGMSGLADRLFPDWGTTDRILLIVALEHVVLVMKLLLAYAIPDLPTWVAEEKARLEFLRREALKRLQTKPSSNDLLTPPSNQNSQEGEVSDVNNQRPTELSINSTSGSSYDGAWSYNTCPQRDSAQCSSQDTEVDHVTTSSDHVISSMEIHLQKKDEASAGGLLRRNITQISSSKSFRN